MKNQLEWLMCDARRILKRSIGIVLGAIMLCPVWGYGRTSASGIVPETYHADIMELSLEQNLLGPEIPKKQIPVIEAYQKEVALGLKKQGYDVELMRDRQIVVVTVPVAKLFNPGSKSLDKNAGMILGKVADLMLIPDKYKILIVAHSDDTGSQEYLNDLTGARANAVTDWLVARKVTADNIVPYGLGADEPRTDNSSRAGREANRRIEMYLVPGPKMIIDAKSGRL